MKKVQTKETSKNSERKQKMVRESSNMLDTQGKPSHRNQTTAKKPEGQCQASSTRSKNTKRNRKENSKESRTLRKPEENLRNTYGNVQKRTMEFKDKQRTPEVNLRKRSKTPQGKRNENKKSKDT